MTPEIIQWLTEMRDTHLPRPGRVLEVGAYNVNGTPRTVFEACASEYIGTDMQSGPGVTVAANNSELWGMFGNQAFETIICCECLEHDINCWDTVGQMRDMLVSGGYLIITTPTFGFPLHRFPKDYYRFGADAYREVFFNGYEVLDLRHIDNACGKGTIIGGIAVKPA